MPTTPDLITALERRGILAGGDVARVRQLHENSPTEFVPRVLFKWLVSRGRLTLDEADRLMAVDANLSAAEALERVLGRADHPEPEDGGADYDEDTKEMPGDAGDDIELAPPGAAPFADSPERSPPLISTPKTPAEKKVERPAASAAYGDLFEELLSGGATGPTLLPPVTPPKRSVLARWDSPLMLVGGGALLLLVIVGSFLTWRVLRQGGDSAFAAAEESYRNAGYATAVERYDKFLADYPNHRSASAAIVHRGLAKLRLAVETGSDWPRALTTAQEVLAEIAPQTEFVGAKAELSALLPEIAEQLTKTAVAQPEAAALDRARSARQLIDKYDAAVDAVAARLQEIDSRLATAERRLARGRRLQETVAAVNQAALARDLDKAAKARSALLREFPDAAAEPTLIEATASLADVKRLSVRMIAENRAAETADPPLPFSRRVVLSHSVGKSVETAATDFAFALLEGSIISLKAASGMVFWTRPVGYDAALPIAVDGATNGDVVFYDHVQQRLIRMTAETSNIAWRQLAPPDGRIAVDRERVCVTHKNRILVYQTGGGKFIGQLDFPTPLETPSSVDPRETVRYQLGAAEDLYVLSNRDLTCLEVFYLGHAAGSVAVAPLCVGPYVLVAENIGEQTKLHLLEAGADGTGLKRVDTRTLPGRVSSQPQVSQRIVAVVTDSGTAELYDFAGSKERKPLEPLARLSGSEDRDVLRRHFLFQGSQLWIGGKGITIYEWQPTLGRLTPIRSLLPDRSTLQPPQRLGSLTACVVQPNDFTKPRSVVAFAADGTIAWESFPAPAPCGPPLFGILGQDWVFVTQRLGVYNLPQAGDQHGIIGYPPEPFPGGWNPAEEARAARLPDAAAVYAAEATDPAKPRPLLVVEAKNNVLARTVSKEPGDWVGDPVAFQDGVLIAAASGQLHWIDPRTGGKKIEPFQPPQVAGRRPAWSRISVVGEDVLASDGVRLYRLGIESQPQPFLKARATIDLVRPTTAEVAAVGETAYLVDGTGELTAYALPDLKPGTSWKTIGARYWGPAAVGKNVFALAAGKAGANGDAQLLCLGGDGKLAWKATVPAHTFLPVSDGDDLLIATGTGTVLRLNAATGEQTGEVKLGIPLGAEPVVDREQIVLTTQAGELLWIAKP